MLRKCQNVTQEYGAEVAKAVSRLPPRPLRGRLGSIDATESYLIGCGRDKLPVVFDEALFRKILAKVLAAIPESVKDLPSNDRVRGVDDDEKTYSRRIGLWTKLATKDLKSPDFWATSQIASVTRSPVGYCLFWNQKGSCRPSKLKGPIFQKSDQILREFEALVCNSAP